MAIRHVLLQVASSASWTERNAQLQHSILTWVRQVSQSLLGSHLCNDEVTFVPNYESNCQTSKLQYISKNPVGLVQPDLCRHPPARG